MENLIGLKVLELNYCKSLKALPDSIGNLTRLKELKLVGCTSLSTLPDSIGNLRGLEELSLGSCRSLSTLPSSISSMSRLSTLVLSGSGLEELPDSVRSLESLKRLGILNCRLRSRLPLWEMKCLEVLAMGDQNNEVCEIPDGITHYSQDTQECRKIRYIESWNDPVSGGFVPVDVRSYKGADFIVNPQKEAPDMAACVMACIDQVKRGGYTGGQF
ncbi:Glucose-repressible alcohol dehydrogenase transcriptional effector [Nymphaea thermarum]|nr:Glucose-repressible alcohol dehydrogenase transcriptional effector [Nymphaea thermarum]